MSLRTQVAILLAVAMLPVGIFAVAQGVANYNETKKLRSEAFALGAVEASRKEQGAILEAFGALSALDSQLDVTATVEECRAMVNRFAAFAPNVPFLGYIPADGIMRCSHPAPKPVDFSQEENFKNFTAAPRRVVTAQQKGQISGQQVLVVSQPVYRNTLFSGALSMSISSQYFEWVAQVNDLPNGARYAIVTADGVGVAQSSSDGNWNWLPSILRLRTSLPDLERLVELPSRTGEIRLFSITPLFKRDIFAIASWPEDMVPSPLGWRDILTIILPMLMWALAVSVAYFAVDQLALRHILYLDRLVVAYGKSGRPLRAHRVKDAPTEIAQLGASFDAMAVDIETREKTLIETVNEKEILLREVNHRVKNNLQLVSSLMNLQIRDANTSHERLGLERLQDRIQGLALVHQRIYESEKMNAIKLDLLISEIAHNLHTGSARTPQSVELKLDLDPIIVPPDQAVPLILFATEAIVNTFKHSLSHVDKGRLHITLKNEEDNLRLRIENSLSGASAESVDDRRGIGQQLIDGFARQLRGHVTRTQTDYTFSIDLSAPKTNQFG